jgi:hypothetical protein
MLFEASEANFVNFIQKSNLPQKAVKAAAVSQSYAEIVENLGIKVIKVAPSRCLPSPVCEHADLQLFHFGGSKIAVSKEQAVVVSELEKLGFDVVKTEPPGGKYPYDCSLNAFFLGDNLFGREKSLAREIIHKNLVNVNQGYCKCSVCIVGESSAITSDPSIAAALESNGVDVLRICAGHIKLSGYSYGFIGGASALIDKDKMLFFGDITKHPDFDKIQMFLKKYNVDFICAKGELTDVGGLIALCE